MNRYYTFAMVLYKDSTSYDYFKVIEYIEKNYNSYAYIEHQPEQDQTKIHTHVLMNFPNKRYVSAISKELGVESNYIINVNLIPYLRYLIHFDNEDKIQYDLEDVKGPLSLRLKEILCSSKKSETEQVSSIMSFIFDTDKWLTLTDLSKFVIDNGCYSAFRRNYHFFKDLLLDHNSKF